MSLFSFPFSLSLSLSLSLALVPRSLYSVLALLYCNWRSFIQLARTNCNPGHVEHSLLQSTYDPCNQQPTTHTHTHTPHATYHDEHCYQLLRKPRPRRPPPPPINFVPPLVPLLFTVFLLLSCDLTYIIWWMDQIVTMEPSTCLFLPPLSFRLPHRFYFFPAS